MFERATIGQIPGQIVIACGALFHLGWITFAIVTYLIEVGERRRRRSRVAMG